MKKQKINKVKKWIYDNRYVIAMTASGFIAYKVIGRKTRTKKDISNTIEVPDFFRVGELGVVGDSIMRQAVDPSERILAIYTNKHMITWNSK